jgi:endonuclease/exonuclease/phosphatase family metal-dependent hydrolase
VLVRSWNLFHGNTFPPGRRAYLRQMVELVTADRPDVVCLQEVPPWALPRLRAWSGMTVVPALARRPLLRQAAIGRALTAPHHGIIRSAFTGQANAILVVAGRSIRGSATLPFPAPEPRIAQRIELDEIAVANVHCSPPPRGEQELAAVLEWLREEPCVVLAGDFNMTPELPGFAGTLAGSIDQVLARGAAVRGRVWEPEEREYGGRLLSDHAPVEADISLA